MSIVKIVQERGREEGIHYYHDFADLQTGEIRYSIQINQDGTLFHWGNVDYKHKPEDPLTVPEWREQNYANIKAETAQGLWEDAGIQEHKVGWAVPKLGLCDCGAEVELEHFTCTCPGCGTDYNSSGQTLADRSQWGEETGENLSDILLVP